MRIELQLHGTTHVCALYASSGVMLGRGQGSTEEAARCAAVDDWGRRQAVVDSACAGMYVRAEEKRTRSRGPRYASSVRFDYWRARLGD